MSSGGGLFGFQPKCGWLLEPWQIVWKTHYAFNLFLRADFGENIKYYTVLRKFPRNRKIISSMILFSPVLFITQECFGCNYIFTCYSRNYIEREEKVFVC